MSYYDCMRHKSVVAEVAGDAGRTGRRLELAVLYDDIARRYWDEMSSKLGARFEIDKRVGVRDEEVYRRALLKHDAIFGVGQSQPPAQRPPFRESKGAGKGFESSKGAGKGASSKRPAEAEARWNSGKAAKTSGPRCFNCRERGHMADQCTNAKVKGNSSV